MKQPIACFFAASALVLAGFSTLFAQERPRYALPEDPTKAWAELDKVHEALEAPEDWQAHKPTRRQVAEFQQQVREKAVAFADKAREFVERWPTNENIGDARVTVVDALTYAVAAGDTNAEKQIAAFVSAVLKDKAIPEDERVEVLLYSGNAVFMKRVGMRLFTEGMDKLDEEFEAASLENLRGALKQFPTNSVIYGMLVSAGQRLTGKRQKELAKEILETPGAPPGIKTLANHMLKGTKPYEIGKPLEIRFTALDGRTVDLAALKGKVVLVAFWATTCPPCVAEMPTIKAVYQKLHERGFEVVAISLDDKEGAVRRFIKEKDLPWPQHFDGKGWGNEFAMRYGVFSIPTLWLVDKGGSLRDTDANFDLEQRVTTLLRQQP